MRMAAARHHVAKWGSSLRGGSPMGDSRDPSRIRVPFSGQKIQIPGTDIELRMGLDLSSRDVLPIAGSGSLVALIAACGGRGTPTAATVVTAQGASVSD